MTHLDDLCARLAERLLVDVGEGSDCWEVNSALNPQALAKLLADAIQTGIDDRQCPRCGKLAKRGSTVVRTGGSTWCPACAPTPDDTGPVARAAAKLEESAKRSAANPVPRRHAVYEGDSPCAKPPQAAADLEWAREWLRAPIGEDNPAQQLAEKFAAVREEERAKKWRAVKTDLDFALAAERAKVNAEWQASWLGAQPRGPKEPGELRAYLAEYNRIDDARRDEAVRKAVAERDSEWSEAWRRGIETAGGVSIGAVRAPSELAERIQNYTKVANEFARQARAEALRAMAVELERHETEAAKEIEQDEYDRGCLEGRNCARQLVLVEADRLEREQS